MIAGQRFVRRRQISHLLVSLSKPSWKVTATMTKELLARNFSGITGIAHFLGYKSNFIGRHGYVIFGSLDRPTMLLGSFYSAAF